MGIDDLQLHHYGRLMISAHNRHQIYDFNFLFFYISSTYVRLWHSDNGGTKSSKFSAIDKNNMNCMGEYSNSPLGQVGVVSLLVRLLACWML